MRRFLLTTAILACVSPAMAGESRLLGTLTSTGTSVNNTTTAVPFSIPLGAQVTLYCDAAGRLLTDTGSVALTGATKGVPVAANTYFPTSVGRQFTLTISGAPSAVLAWISVSGTTNCDVWIRAGTE